MSLQKRKQVSRLGVVACLMEILCVAPGSSADQSRRNKVHTKMNKAAKEALVRELGSMPKIRSVERMNRNMGSLAFF